MKDVAIRIRFSVVELSGRNDKNMADKNVSLKLKGKLLCSCCETNKNVGMSCFKYENENKNENRRN